MRIRETLSCGLAAFLLIACAKEPSPAGPVLPPVTSASQANIDLGAVIRQVRHAYRPEPNGTWRGGYQTYDIHVSDVGLELRAFHHPDAPSDPRSTSQLENAARVVESSPVRLGRTRIARGTKSLDGTHAKLEGRNDGSLQRISQTFTEFLVNTEQGVEQSWGFPSEPAGKGDLHVRIPLTGMDFVAETSSGLHFKDPATGVGFRYGHATWVDAEGRRTKLPVRWTGGEIHARVPERVLTTSTWPAVLDPVISPEFGIDQPVIAPAPNDQNRPSVASNGTVYLVVWADKRAGTSSRTFGARVDTSGLVLDPSGLSLGDGYDPSVASNGSDFLVVSVTTSGASDRQIVGKRVTANGVVLDYSSIQISSPSSSQSEPTVASNGTDYFVAWTITGGSYTAVYSDVYGRRVSAGGVLLDPSSIAVAKAPLDQHHPAVASNGTDYFVVWTHDYGTYANIAGTRVNASTGAVLNPSGISITADPGEQSYPVVASAGTQYLVAWQDKRSGNFDLRGTRVTGAGTVLDPGGIVLASAPGDQRMPKMSSDGSGYLLAWEDTRSGAVDVYGARVDGAGAVLDASGIPISTAAGNQTFPCVAYGGSDYLVAWTDFRNGTTSDIYGARVSTGGALLDPSGIPLSTLANAQNRPALATNGNGLLVVWQDSRNGVQTDIYAARLSPTGTVLDPSGIALATGADLEEQPSVASNGTDYFVVWQDRRSGTNLDVYGTRVSGAGAVLDPGGIPVSAGPDHESNPAIASNGNGYLVVWEDYRSGYYDIYGTRIDATGAVLDPNGIALTTAASHQINPAIASDGNDYLVAWEDGRNGSVRHIYGTRISAAGSVLDPAGLALSVVSTWSIAPAIASNGSGYLVAWSDRRSGNENVYATRVTATGTVDPPAGFPLSTAPNSRKEPCIATNGTDYFVAWEDLRNGNYRDIYGTRVTAAGLIQDPSGLGIAVTAEEQDQCAVVSTGANGFVVAHRAYSRGFPTPPSRIKAHLVTLSEPSASDGTATTNEDTPVTIPLVANDPNGDALTYVLVGSPANGTVTVNGSNATFTPSPDFHGSASFQFKVNDGAEDSNIATVTVTVLPVNDAPVVPSLTATTDEEQSVTVTLGGTDVDGDALTYAVVGPVGGGSVVLSGASALFTPTPDFNGLATFDYVANDGTIDSAPNTVSITVKPINDAPLAEPTTATTSEDLPVVIALTGSDIDGDLLTFSLSGGPANGTVTIVGSSATYSPAANFFGADSFTFTTSDGVLSSAPATVTLTISAVNDAPVSLPQTLTVDEDQSVAVTLGGSDIEGDALTFSVVTPPSHGTLSGVAPNLDYLPAANFHGTDSFTFRVSDGTLDSADATVSILVNPVNDAPVALAQALQLNQGEQASITLSGTDVDGDALSYAIIEPSPDGVLSGAPPNLTFEPATGFRGQTQFTFTVSDGVAQSAPAVVTLLVGNMGPTVTVAADSLKPMEGQTVQFSATAADPGGDQLTFEWDFGDGASSTEQAPVHAFRDQGSYAVTVTVSDGKETATATVELDVRNAAPSIVPATESVSGEEATVLFFEAEVSDPGVNDTVSVTWSFGDASEPVSGTSAQHAYADDGNYLVTVTATDSDGAVTIGTREVSISNVPPVPRQTAEVEVLAGDVATATLDATDRAGDQDPLTWKLVEGPGEVAPDGSWSWKTRAEDRGEFLVRAEVTDDEGGTAESVFTVKVTTIDEPDVSASGCGCASGGGSSAVWGVALMLLFAVPRRRSWAMRSP